MKPTNPVLEVVNNIEAAYFNVSAKYRHYEAQAIKDACNDCDHNCPEPLRLKCDMVLDRLEEIKAENRCGGCGHLFGEGEDYIIYEGVKHCGRECTVINRKSEGIRKGVDQC